MNYELLLKMVGLVYLWSNLLGYLMPLALRGARSTYCSNLLGAITRLGDASLCYTKPVA